MFTHTVLSREVLEQDGCNSKLRALEFSNPRGQLTSAPPLYSLLGPCVFSPALSLSPLISWAYWVMIAHRSPVTEDVSWLSGIQEAPAVSTVSAQGTALWNTRTDTRTDTHVQQLVLFCVHWHKHERKKCFKTHCYKNRWENICELLWTSWKHKKLCCEWNPNLIKDHGWGYSSLWLSRRTFYISVMHCRN